MADNSSIIQRAFNQHLKDFVDDIERLFPDSVKVRTLKNSILAFIKMNPKKPIELWASKVNARYMSQIMNEDIGFFLKSDFSQDISEAKNKGINVSVDLIDELKEHIKNMNNDNNIQSAIKYIKEMTQLCSLYYS